jgi:hypothetical protein
MSFFSSLSSFKPFGSFTHHEDTLARQVAGIASNQQCVQQAQRAGLAIQTVSWEDAGRYKNSSVGPNISDLTLRINAKSDSHTLLPMIRYANFSDKTVDLPIDQFHVTVGNETKSTGMFSSRTLKRITLKEYLENMGEYVKTASGTPVKSLYCSERDSVVLASAQYCILPLASGTVEFNVNLYNYQSSSDEPAVLVLVCSQKGTSAQAIFGGTTQLYFNNGMEASNYVAERLKEERRRLGKNEETKMDSDENERNCLFIYQIPLKVKERTRGFVLFNSGKKSMGYNEEECCDDVLIECCESMVEQCQSFSSPVLNESATRSLGMDNAMLSVGKSHSKFEGIKDFTLERDTRFPIRCTCQFYKTTDEQTIPNEAWTEMKNRIDTIYTKGLAQGSLVADGKTERKTEWDAEAKHSSKEFVATLPQSEVTTKPLGFFL